MFWFTVTHIEAAEEETSESSIDRHILRRRTEKMEVGFLGLGMMGKAMAVNLLRNGFKVTVWNRTSAKCEELARHGASVSSTPAEVVEKCRFTIAMLSDPSAALSVVFDKDGVLEQICQGKCYIDMSTVDAETSSKISEAILKRGGSFLEAPVSGSKKPAEDGQLVILCAGDKDLYKEMLPAFDVLGKKSFFLGQVGNGAKMKLVVNMIMGSMMNAFAEGLVLADGNGLNQGTLLEILHQQKDMRLALELGNQTGVTMPVASTANESFEKGMDMGLGDLDFSAVHEALSKKQ